jgi:type I restriction enzyme M protein
MTNCKTEDDVKIQVLLPYIEGLGYKTNHCEFNKAIEVQEGRKVKKIFADVVVYSSASKTAPLILCETKAPNEILNRFVKEQAISYARLLPRIAPLVLITNGTQFQFFQTLNKNRIPELPRRKDLEKDILNFLISKDTQNALRLEAVHGLFIIDDVVTFKNVLRACHNEIRNNEGYDPTVAFDEMSKVLFCKLYEEKHSGRNRFRLAVFDDTLDRLQINVVKQIFEETKKDVPYSGLFLPDAAINLNDRTIRKIVQLFENYDLSLTAFDVKGEAFEYFLGDTFTGGLGEYFTPRNIVEFVVDALDPRIGEKMIDPFCGTGGFLIYAFDLVSDKIRMQDFAENEKARWKQELSDRSVFGTDWKERTSQACKMNMQVHGDGSSGIFMHHGLVNIPGRIENNSFAVCVTNPPFGSVENDTKILAKYELGSGRKSQDRLILAIERSIELVKSGGRIGIIVIDGILNNDSTRYVRDYIRRNTWIKAIISLNKETFEGYGARAKTSILLLEKKQAHDDEKQHPIFMAIAKNTGYAPNGAQISGNDLPDILMAYKAFLGQDQKSSSTADCWIAECDDRLDAEYYWNKTDKTIRDVASIQTSVTELLAAVNSEYLQLTKDLNAAFQSHDFDLLSLGDVLEPVQQREKVDPDANYRLIGVRWWGGGVFIREEKSGREIKGSHLYRVLPGQLIYNRLFAFRGSFAIVGREYDGCHASSEFPTFQMKPLVTIPNERNQYIVHCLNSANYLKIVDRLSTGSTKQSRNRFKEDRLLGMKIEMPRSDAALSRLVEMLNRADILRIRQQSLLEGIKELREGIGRMLPTPRSSEA